MHQAKQVFSFSRDVGHAKVIVIYGACAFTLNIVTGSLIVVVPRNSRANHLVYSSVRLALTAFHMTSELNP